MSTQKHPMSIYTVMLILSMIFMFLANVLMIIEYYRWRDTGATPRAELNRPISVHESSFSRLA